MYPCPTPVTRRMCVAVCTFLVTWFSTGVHGYNCKFPTDLYDRGINQAWWLHHVTNCGVHSSHNTIQYVEIYGSHMSATSLPADDVTHNPAPFEWECEHDFGKHIFLVRYDTQQQDGREYQCIQITKHSKHAIQINQGSITSNRKLNCLQEPLTPDPWLYVRYSEAVEDPMDCPFHGGFNLELFRSDGTNLCEKPYTMSARYECGCSTDGIITFDLTVCPHSAFSIGMETRQSLVSVANWKENDTRFSLLKRSDVALYWIFSHRTMNDGSITAALSADIVIDANADVNFNANSIQMKLTRSMITSSCVDVSPDCQLVDNVCSEDNAFGRLYCEESCMKCSQSSSACVFKENIQGTWMPLHKDEDSFEITKDSFKSAQFTLARCGSYDKISSTYKVVKFNPIGCYPESTCITIKPFSASVIRYKMFSGPYWTPLSRYMSCFQTVEANRIPLHSHFRLAVKVSPVYVQCGIPGSAYDVMARSEHETLCRARIFKEDCLTEGAESFTLEYTDCPHEHLPQQTQQFQCLAQLPYLPRRKLVLAKLNTTNEVVCIYFKIPVDSFMILPPEKCHGGHTEDDYISTIRVIHEDVSCLINAETKGMTQQLLDTSCVGTYLANGTCIVGNYAAYGSDMKLKSELDRSMNNVMDKSENDFQDTTNMYEEQSETSSLSGRRDLAEGRRSSWDGKGNSGGAFMRDDASKLTGRRYEKQAGDSESHQTKPRSGRHINSVPFHKPNIAFIVAVLAVCVLH